MKTVKFQDSHNQEIQISLSGGGDYRVYVTDGSDETKTMCLLLNEPQAQILINALKDLIREE